ncbi:type 1 glutamine amidotransferase domain-containing protein [Massilia sp. YIM B02443]|uniref:type 1 glutamine amidotransferase domain-containing protein n=1 Tax=Massilia sp. YIM B02443 TaxID=3050127 RepID=UPI0025B6AE82|nr:type 1 glutamine amidotransferase domain-containing protein [Massilia sp. YIM B02443]MDN4036719.1 type 1 glutamine amidotransferase domain-containing protein [Massilia sp. YIM B02443]
MEPAEQVELNAQSLQGRRVAVLMTDGVEQVEYTKPRSFLEGQGVQVTLLSPKGAGEQVQGFNHLDPADKFTVDLNVAQAQVGDYDLLLLPGGVANPDNLRLSPESIAFIKAFGDEDKPIAAICHGPWPLIDAGVAESKHMTSWPSLQTDLRNAGAEWTDEEVVVDGKLITSRKPDDIPAFNEAIRKQLMVLQTAGSDPGPTS